MELTFEVRSKALGIFGKYPLRVPKELVYAP
jgi:hypothetical protein